MSDEHEEVVEQTDETPGDAWESAKEEQPSGGWVGKFREAGYELDEDYDDDRLQQDLFKTLGDAQQWRQSHEELEKVKPYAQEYMQNAADFQKWKEEQAKKQQAEAPKEPEKPKWQAPDYDQEIASRVRWDAEAQRFVPKTAYDSPEAANKANAWLKHEQTVRERLAKDPLGLVKEAGLEDYIAERERALEERIISQMQSRTTYQQTQTQLQSFFQQNADKLLQFDEQGQPTGYTPAGQAYQAAVQQARSLMGVSPQEVLLPDEMERVHQFAVAAASQYVGQSPTTPPVEKPRDAKGKFIDRAKQNGKPRNRLPGSGGTMNSDPQNTAKGVNFSDIAAQVRAELGQN